MQIPDTDTPLILLALGVAMYHVPDPERVEMEELEHRIQVLRGTDFEQINEDNTMSNDKTLATPITAWEVKDALAANELPPNGERIAMMEKALEQFAAGREGWHSAAFEAINIFPNSSQMNSVLRPNENLAITRRTWHSAVLSECTSIGACYQESDPAKTIRYLIDWHRKDAVWHYEQEAAGRVAASPAPVQTPEPFMYAIQGPDGKAHFDESCVSADGGDLKDVLFYLNEEQKDGPYKIIPLYVNHIAEPVLQAKLDFSTTSKSTEQDRVTWCGYVAGMIEQYLKDGGACANRETVISLIIQRRLKFLAPAKTSQAAEPAPPENQSREQDADVAAQNYCRSIWGAARGYPDWRRYYDAFVAGYMAKPALPAEMPNKPISRAEWIAQAKAFYIESGDNETTARECAKYLCNQQDWAGSEVGDPRYEAQEDVQGRGRTGVVALAHAQPVAQKAEAELVAIPNEAFELLKQLARPIWYPGLAPLVPLFSQPLYTAPQAQALTSAELQSYEMHIAQADEIREILNALAPETEGNLQTRVKQALTDPERLDFLVTNSSYVVCDEQCDDGFWLHYVREDGTTWVQVASYKTPRDAIDAAMAAKDAA